MDKNTYKEIKLIIDLLTYDRYKEFCIGKKLFITKAASKLLQDSIIEILYSGKNKSKEDQKKMQLEEEKEPKKEPEKQEIKRKNIGMSSFGNIEVGRDLYEKFAKVTYGTNLDIDDLKTEILEKALVGFIIEKEKEFKLKRKVKKAFLKCCGNCKHLSLQNGMCNKEEYEAILTDMICSRWEG